MIAFNKARARARKIHRQRKRESWIKYVSNITCSTSSKEVWNKIRKLSGKYSASPVSMLVSNGVSVNTIPDIANILAEAFAKTSSCDNYTPAFQVLKRREERVKLNFSSSNEEGYNSPLTLRELRAALHRSGNTASGPDGLHYIMLRHLSESSILSLLSLFNHIWKTQVFPTQWCHAHVLPFPKPGKDPTSANNYHPIALTSCLSKLMERIVSARLMFHLESHNLLESWSQQLDNKLHSVKPVIGAWPVMPMRSTDVKLTRLRIGHTRLTHRHLLFGEHAPECPSCNVSFTVHHILIDCPVLNHHRITFFHTSILTLSDLVGEIPHQNLFAFIKKIGFLYLI
ncbi:putative RNA-directed DNA polymerase from transposon BS [Trichonephila clavipes]|nr:putative RNA-directed DNA polymerase from transposon BS [Trichonephila clavipes]